MVMLSQLACDLIEFTGYTKEKGSFDLIDLHTIGQLKHLLLYIVRMGFRFFCQINTSGCA